MPRLSEGQVMSVSGYFRSQYNLGKLGPDTPNQQLGHMKINSTFSSLFPLAKALLDFESHLRVQFNLICQMGHYGNQMKLRPNTQNYQPEKMQSNSKTLAPYFTPDEAILSCQGHPRAELDLLEIIKDIWDNLGETGSKTANYEHRHMKSNLTSSTSHFTFKKVLLNCIGHCYCSVVPILGHQGYFEKLCPSNSLESSSF